MTNLRVAGPKQYFYESESRSVMSDSLQPHGLSSPWNSLGQNTAVGSLPLLQEIFATQVSHNAGGFLPAEPPGKPKNTGVGNLPLLRRIVTIDRCKSPKQELSGVSVAVECAKLPTG